MSDAKQKAAEQRAIRRFFAALDKLLDATEETKKARVDLAKVGKKQGATDAK